MGIRQVRDGQSLSTRTFSLTQLETSRRAEHAMDSRKTTLSERCRRVAPAALAFLLTVLLSGGNALGSVTASIAGTVRDPSGAVIAGATVTATNVETGIAQTMHTNGQGYYSFQSLSLGHYNVDVHQTGFAAFHETGLVLDVNSALVVDVVIQVGEVKQAVTVSSSVVHVETANTQLGDVITSQSITAVPLVSRSYTDLLALQPGVGSTTSGIDGGGGGTANAGSNFIAVGFTMMPVSGSLNAGNLSVNGMRESSNGFLMNGAVVQEFGFGGTAVIPDLDSLAEFRIITNNFDAEYGNYSGGQINVITKSGTNRFHGDLFEFLRNTDLDSRNYFDPARGSYNQNQFGGTIGGPIKHDKIFFFGDYQGNRVVQGVSTGLIPVPSLAERRGDFSQVFNSSSQNQMTGTVNGAAWASDLSNELGYSVVAGESYFTPGCTVANCVFPGAQVPTGAVSSIAPNLLKYIPAPNNGAFYSTSGFPSRLRDDKTSGRIDANSRFGMLSAYYYLDDYALQGPYTGSSSLPGFGSVTSGKAQDINLSDTKAFSNAAVNEFRFQYVRNVVQNLPSTLPGIVPSSLGFTGVIPVVPAYQGVPSLDFNSFSVGTLSRAMRVKENTFQWLDNYRKVVAKHTLSVGGNYQYIQVQENLITENPGFNFFGSETGIDFADFLVGAPSAYYQGYSPSGNIRSHYMGVYAQDSWRVASNLTLNYGLRWEAQNPWVEQHGELETIVPGLQSKVFPNAPVGWVFPGDPGVPRGLAPTRYNNFAPRVGLAYAVGGGRGWLSKLTGAGQTSIRVAYGMFYTTATEGALAWDEIGDAPYGVYTVQTNPTFANPWENRPNGGPPAKDPFPVQMPPPSDLNFADAGFLPISSSPGLYYKNRVPYAQSYDLSIQRQFGSSTILTVSYVGTQGRRLFSTLEANPGSPSMCNYLNANGATPACGPGGENTTYVLPAGVAAPPGSASVATTLPCVSGSGNCNAVLATRTALGSNFGSDAYLITKGQSSFNSLQVNLKRTAKSFTFLAGYTFSKSLDTSSAWAEQVNPLNPSAEALSAFDQRNNFVLSYAYNLPFDKLGGPKRLTGGWQLSGILRFASGVPVTLYETDDNSLLGTSFSGPMPIGIDTPVFTGTSIHKTDARATGNYFDPSQFVTEPLGTLGSSRRFFSGPGLNNWDMALLKDTKLNERTSLEFRAEFFNIFNHTQFSAANGNINNATFGSVLSAAPPRIGQLSLKLYF